MVSDAPKAPSRGLGWSRLAALGRRPAARRLSGRRWRGLTRTLAFGVAGLLLTELPLPGTPGGLWASALGAAAAARGAWIPTVSVMAGMVVGQLLGTGGGDIGQISLLLLFALVQASLRASREQGRLAPEWQALVLMAFQFLAGLFGASGDTTWMALLKEFILPPLALASGFLLWLPLIGPGMEGPVPRSLGMAILLILAAGGVWTWRGTVMEPAWLFGSAAVQLGALVGGAGAGAGLGLGIGGFWAWSLGLPAGWATLLGLAGLVGGLLRPLGRLAVHGGFWVGLLFTLPQVADPTLAQQIVLSGALATAGTALLPRALLRRWEARWTPMDAGASGEDLRAEVGADLRKVGALFEKIAHQMEPDSLARPDEEVGRFIQAVHREACQACPAHDRCWERETYATYWDMVEMVGVVEGLAESPSEKGLPHRLARRCTHHDRLLKGIALTLPRFRAAQQELGRWHREHSFLPDQFRALARLVDSMASRVEDGARSVEEVERALRQTLAGTVDLKLLRCTRVGPNRYRVEGQIRGECPEPGYCERVIAPLVSRRLGRPYAVWSTSCQDFRQGGGCRFELMARRRYSLDVADAGVQREGELHSGDCIERTELADGRVAVVLSDGMGSGAPAWQESRTAVTLLRSLLEVGLELQAAIRTVNSLLRSRSPQVRFATLDMLVVDLYTGEAELLKIGAAPSLVIQDGTIEIVESESPPAGVVEELEADVHTLSLSAKDQVVLASDGLWEAGGRRRPDWLVEEVSRFRDEEPAVLAEILVARARELRQAGQNDDATVLVARLEPAGSAGERGEPARS